MHSHCSHSRVGGFVSTGARHFIAHYQNVVRGLCLRTTHRGFDRRLCFWLVLLGWYPRSGYGFGCQCTPEKAFGPPVFPWKINPLPQLLTQREMPVHIHFNRPRVVSLRPCILVAAPIRKAALPQALLSRKPRHLPQHPPRALVVTAVGRFVVKKPLPIEPIQTYNSVARI